MKTQGLVFKYPDNVDTDVIIPARYLNAPAPEELAKHCMEDIDDSFASKVQPGDIMVAGANFGCGSSREHAPIALKGAGVAAVIAESFARIFYRNATNVGVPLLEAPGISKLIEDGEEITVDMQNATITSQNGETVTFKKLPPFMLEILNQGGLIEYLKNKR